MIYTDPEVFAATRDRVFARTWQWLGDLGDVALPQSLSPRDLLPGLLDDLPQVPFAEWFGHGFAALDPIAPFDKFIGNVRTPWLAPDHLVHDPARDRDYSITAHWALYVENYLEGFHIPFVHASLLDTGAGRGLDRVEAEDEAIVESVARGVRSRLYRGGRYSPTRERGVHHFHRLLAEFLAVNSQAKPGDPS